MKKRLRIISAAMAIIMALSAFVGFAASYADVPSDSAAYEGVSILSSLNILTGYSDGSFKEENTITRAEFATVIIRALGLGDAASGAGGATGFSDVPTEHWASGYINLASNNGIINGYPDGTFRPEEPVLYEQAVKMIIAALGYTPEAETKGGYPGGYITIAAREGILSGVKGVNGSEATRGTVAQMVYNALEVPMMEQVGFGTDTSFEKVATIMLDKLDVEKVEGKVTKIPGSSDTRIQSYMVEYTVTKRYEDVNGRRVMRNVNQVIKPDVGDTNAREYLEKYTYAYIKDIDEDYPEIVAIVPKGGKNESFSISSTDIDVSKTSYITGAGKFYYFEDEDKDRATYVNVETTDSKLTYYYNGKKVSGSGLISQFKTLVDNGINGVVEFLDNTSDDVFDVIYVTDYRDIVVDTISIRNYRIVGKNNEAVVLDEENDDYSFEIIKNGEKVDFDTIRVGDVLSICGNFESKELTNGTVYIVSNSTIDGTIKGINDSEKIVSIDGVSYEYTLDDSEIKLGYEGIFYINRMGKIIAMDKTNMATNFKFGFMMNMGNIGGITTSLRANILTSDGVWKEYEFADKITVNSTTNGVRADTVVANWNSYKPSDWAGTVSGSIIPVYTMVSYSVNSSGYINKINFDLANRNVTDNDYMYKTFTDSIYNNYSESLGGGIFTQSNTIIFDIGVPKAQLYTAGKADISVGTASMLIHNAKYTGNAFVNIDTSEAVAMMGFNMTSEIQYTESAMIVSGIEQTYDDGDILTRLTVYADGEKKTVSYDPNEATISDMTGLSIGTGIKVGDVISTSMTSSNIAKKIAIVFRPTEMFSGNAVINPYRNGNNIVVYSPTGSAEDIDFVYGIVRSRTNRSYSVAFDDRYEKAGTYTMNSSTNVYVYDKVSYANPRIIVGDSSDIEVDKTIDNSAYSEDGSFVFMRIDSNTWIRDVIIIRQDPGFRDDNRAPSASPSPTPTPAEAAGPTSMAVESVSQTPTAAESASPSPTAAESASPSPTAAESASPSPTPAESASPTPAESASPTPTPAESASPSPTPAESASPTPTPAETASPTPTPAETASPTPTPAVAETASPSPALSKFEKIKIPSTEKSITAVPKLEDKSKIEKAMKEAVSEKDVKALITSSLPLLQDVSTVVVRPSLSSAKTGEEVIFEGKRYIKGKNAFADINSALKAVSSGGTVLLYNTSYNGDIKVTKPVTIKGIDKKTTYINGSFDISANNVVLKDMNIVYNKSGIGECAVVLRDNVKNSTVSVAGCNLLNAGKSTGVAIKGGIDKVGMETAIKKTVPPAATIAPAVPAVPAVPAAPTAPTAPAVQEKTTEEALPVIEEASAPQN